MAKNSMLVKNLDKIKTTAKNLHLNAINISDSMVDGSLANGKKWQKLFAKAMQNGTVLFEKQQDIFVDTVEALKGQYDKSENRLKKLFNLRLPKYQPKKAFNSPNSKADKATKSTLSKAKRVVKKAKAGTTTDQPQNDLKIIEGIGPKIEQILTKAGIISFKLLAATDVKTLKNILAAAGPRFAKYNPSSWRQQARLAATGKMDKLKELQNKLK